MRREALAVLLLTVAGPLAAQRPAELAGRVVESDASAAVVGAAVELPELGLGTWTDAAGRFTFAGVEPGQWRLRVTRTGFDPVTMGVELRAGERGWQEVRLVPAAVALAAVRVEGEAGEGGVTLRRGDIERSGAQTVAAVLERVPGLVVRSGGASGARTISIRGSAASQVLVLVDGVPINDPVSGEADLSSIPAASVESVAVLPGARSARWGPGAAAGVVVIRTRRAAAGGGADVALGSLGERAAGAAWGIARGAATARAGARLRVVEGAFTHPRDANDPRIVRRANADLHERSGFVVAASRLGGGELTLRGGGEALRRGLPGAGHTPSPHARQALARGRGSAAWRGSVPGGTFAASVAGVAQRIGYADPEPPFAHPYDDTTSLRQATVRVEHDGAFAPGAGARWGWGIDASVQRVISTALAADAPTLRREAGLFGRVTAPARAGGVPLTLTAEGRADRDARSGALVVTHALGAGASVGDLRLHASHRSSYAPPTLGDQFFRAPIGIAAAPELAAQRVPGEWELAAGWNGGVGGADVSVDASAYRGTVRGMVVWLPDFRFLWSPRNVDAYRSGAEARIDARFPGLRAHAAWTRARATWADPAARGVQLPYRPLHTATTGAEIEHGAWRVDAGARFTGARYPAAARINRLPGFWSTRLRVDRAWTLNRWTLHTALDVDRALDERDALIAGFPEPGRRVRLDVRIERTHLMIREP